MALNLAINDNVSIVNGIGCVAGMKQTVRFEVENQIQGRRTSSKTSLR